MEIVVAVEPVAVEKVVGTITVPSSRSFSARHIDAGLYSGPNGLLSAGSLFCLILRWMLEAKHEPMVKYGRCVRVAFRGEVSLFRSEMSLMDLFFGKSLYLCAAIYANFFKVLVFMNNYETVFIATPVLNDAQLTELVGKFRGVITENGGQIVSQEDWGLRKLAYPIQKKSTGFYFLLQFTGEGSIIEKLETQYNRDERVIRFLTFKMDKHAVEYAEKRRKTTTSRRRNKPWHRIRPKSDTSTLPL